jgi:hypothetical protein
MDSIYEYLPCGQTPFRPAGLLPATPSVDSDIENLVQKLDLLYLYHLDRLCIDLITHICKAIQMTEDTKERNLGSDLLLADKIPTENDILSLVQGLIKSYPQVGKLFDSDLLVRDVFAARTFFQKKRKLIPTASLLELEHLQESVQRAITQGTWDRTTQPKTYLESFALGCIHTGHEEALVYLCMKGSGCDTAIDEVAAQWNGYRKDAAGDIRKLKALLGGTSNYATVFRLIQWAELSNFQPFWEGSELFDAMMPKGKMPDGVLAFPIFRSDDLIGLFKVQLEMLLVTWQDAMIYWRKRKGWPAKDQKNDYLSFVAVAAAFVFGYYRLKSSSIDKTLVTDVINWLLDTRQTNGWYLHRSDEVDEKDIAITAMVVHALSLAKRYGHKRILKSASDWLRHQLQPYGCWGTSSPACTTVLVLDALELAGGGMALTFKMQDKENTLSSPQSKPKQIKIKMYKKSLSEKIAKVVEDHPSEVLTADKIAALIGGGTTGGSVRNNKMWEKYKTMLSGENRKNTPKGIVDDRTGNVDVKDFRSPTDEDSQDEFKVAPNEKPTSQDWDVVILYKNMEDKAATDILEDLVSKKFEVTRAQANKRIKKAKALIPFKYWK